MTILALIGQTWWAINQDKQLTLDAQAANGMVAVRILEEHATQTLKDAVYTLDQVAASVQLAVNENDRHARRGNTEAVINRILGAAELKQVRHLKTLQFVNRDGLSWIRSPDVAPHQEDLSDREYIRQLMADTTYREVWLGHPYPSRYDSQLVIPVARNLFDADGKWLGILSVDLRLSYFSSVYARVAKDSKASVSLIANEGFVFVRSPFEARYLDRDISDSTVLTQLRTGPDEGTFAHDSFLDDELPRLYSYRKVPGFPVTTIYGRDFDTILLPWRERSRDRILLSALMTAFILGMTVVMQVYETRLRKSRESLSRSEYRFAGLFDRSPIPLVLLDQIDNRIIEVNEAWLVQFGFRKQEVIDRTPTELNIWVDYEQRLELVRQVARGEAVDYQDVSLQHRDGSKHVYLLSVRHFADGQQELVIFTFVDVTRQRQVELELREFNLQLEERVASRTHNLELSNQTLSEALTSVNEMQAELIRSEKMVALGSLVAGVAHELNTPIGNSVTIASTLQDQTRHIVQDVGANALKRSSLDEYLANQTLGTDLLMRTLTRAAELISSFKRVAVDQSSNARRKFRLDDVLHEVGLMLEATRKSSAYKLEYDLASGIELDSYPGSLGQVITNLVNNSLLHGFEGRDSGVMCITSRLVDENTAQISFSDDGVGVSETVLRRIFDPFFTTKLGKGGSGLGMNIVYNIVRDELGGKVDVTSVLGAGLTVTLTLPLCAPDKLVPV